MSDLPIILSVITFMYFMSGLQKLIDINKVSLGLLKRLNIKAPLVLYKLAIIAVILIEIICSINIVYASLNNKYRKVGVYSAYILAAFTILVTLIYHFPPYGHTYYAFISNVTSLGALLLTAYVLKNKKYKIN